MKRVCSSAILVGVIASFVQPIFLHATRNSRLENVIARREGERELQNRSSVVIPVKFSRPTFPPTNRSGGQVDGKERPYYTPHPPLPLALHRCLCRLLFLLSPPGFSAFSAIAVVTTSYHLGRLSSPILRSWILLVQAAHFAPALTSSSEWLRPGRWQHPYRYLSTRILTATGCWSIILGVRIFRWSDRQV